MAPAIQIGKGTAYAGIMLFGRFYFGIQHNALILRRLAFHGTHIWIGPFYFQV